MAVPRLRQSRSDEPLRSPLVRPTGHRMSAVTAVCGKVYWLARGRSMSVLASDGAAQSCGFARFVPPISGEAVGKKQGSAPNCGSRASFRSHQEIIQGKGSYFADDPLREGGCPSRQPVDCHQAFPPRWLLLSELTRPPPLYNKAIRFGQLAKSGPFTACCPSCYVCTTRYQVSLTIPIPVTSPNSPTFAFFWAAREQSRDPEEAVQKRERAPQDPA